MANDSISVANPALVARMNEFLENRNEDTELRMIDEIYRSNFLAPVRMIGEGEGQQKGVGFELVTAKNGDSYFAAFTDEEELGKWRSKPGRTLVYTYQDYKKIVQESDGEVAGFIINPGSSKVRITPQIMEHMESRLSLSRIPEGTHVKIGQPANYPQELVDALIPFFKENADVHKAYLCLAQREQEDPNLLLLVDCDCEKAPLFSAIGAVARKHLPEGARIEMSGADTPFGQKAIAGQKPIYDADAE